MSLVCYASLDYCVCCFGFEGIVVVMVVVVQHLLLLVGTTPTEGAKKIARLVVRETSLVLTPLAVIGM